MKKDIFLILNCRKRLLSRESLNIPLWFILLLKLKLKKSNHLFEDIGITLAGITTVPFAVQNIFRSKWMPATEEIFASLFIGNNFSRIDVYKKENLVMTRGIKTGSTSTMVEAIVSRVLEKTGNVRLSHDEAKEILASLASDPEKIREKKTVLRF